VVLLCNGATSKSGPPLEPGESTHPTPSPPMSEAEPAFCVSCNLFAAIFCLLALCCCFRCIRSCKRGCKNRKCHCASSSQSYTPLPQQEVEMLPKPQAWTCLQCTLENSGVNTTCAACGALPNQPTLVPSGPPAPSHMLPPIAAPMQPGLYPSMYAQPAVVQYRPPV